MERLIFIWIHNSIFYSVNRSSIEDCLVKFPMAQKILSTEERKQNTCKQISYSHRGKFWACYSSGIFESKIFISSFFLHHSHLASIPFLSKSRPLFKKISNNLTNMLEMLNIEYFILIVYRLNSKWGRCLILPISQHFISV